MQSLGNQVIRKSLEQVIIAFFVVCALFIVAVYTAVPSIITQGLMLTPSPKDRYPLVATVFILALLAWIAIGIVGVVRHWRWLFWLLLVAFGFSVLQIPATILELIGVLPNPTPVWYSLSRMGVALVEVGIGVWMWRVYRRYGVWAMGKKKQASA